MGPSIHHIYIQTTTIMKQFIIVTFYLASVMGFKSYNMAHTNEAQEAQNHDNCVDISHYGEVEYNTTTTQMCGYKKNTYCQPRESQVCRDIPVTECRVVGFTECQETPSTQTVSDDSLELENFIPQECYPGAVKILSETKKLPECHNVTKQQCDSKWEVDAYGQKVWAGNENCRDVTWEDCKLVDKVVTQEIESYDCQPSSPISYHKVIHNKEEVTTIKRSCKARAESACEVRTETQCETVQWEECQDSVQPHCFDFQTRIPHQEYNHLLRCTVAH